MSSTGSIMVVDDEIELASLFKAFLEKHGYTVISFTDPLLALDYFKETHDLHSLLITDLRMPGLCGLSLSKEIRKINKKIRIFLMTAFDIHDLKGNEDFQIAKIDNILQKPIKFSNLLKMIKTTS